MKLQEVIGSVPALNALLDIKIPAKLSFKIARLASKLAPEVDTYQKTREVKMKEYGTLILDDEGNPTDKYKFEGEAKDKFIEEMTAVENTEVSVEIPEVSIDDFGDIEIEAKHLSVLTWLIKQ